MPKKCVVKDKCGCCHDGFCTAAVDSYSMCVEDRLGDDATKLAEVTEVCKDSNAVCVCGCPASEHESYGDEGECCGNEDHECIRTSCSVAELVARLKAKGANWRHLAEMRKIRIEELAAHGA